MASVMSASPSLAPIRRLFDREDYKQALKEARVVHRKTPTDESRQLLARCCLARTGELVQRGFGDEARKLIEELAGLRPLPDDLKPGLPELLVRAGAYDRFAATFGLQSADAGELSPALADAAIVSGANVPGASNRAEADAIRRAFAALDAGDADALAAALEPIPRNSPFADWKLFVRGAAARFRGDDETCQANWKRLDPARKAAVIARHLTAADLAASAPPTAAGAETSDPVAASPVASGSAVSGKGAADADRARSVALVERAAFGGEALSHLHHLKELMDGGDQRRILGALRAATTVLGERAPRLRDRLIELVVQKAIASHDRELLENLTRAASAPSDDPKWNRAWALYWEFSDAGDGLDSSEDLARKHWLALADDIQASESRPEQERNTARALVFARVARDVAEWVVADEEEFEEMDADEWDIDHFRSLITTNRNQVGALLDEARRIAPDVRRVWDTEVQVRELWHDDDGLIDVLSGLVERFPNDYDSLRRLGIACLDLKSDPVRALDSFDKARRLKPLDESLLPLRWRALADAARLAAVERDFDTARARLAEAEACDPAGERRLLLLGQRSILERKAGNDEEAIRLEAEATQLLEEPTAVLLVLATEAARHRLQSQTVKAYRDDWEKKLKRRCNGQTAAMMAMAMARLIVARVEYDGFHTHLQAVCDYIDRTSKVKYDRLHLRAVCGFYHAFDKRLERSIRGGVSKSLLKLGKRGTKLFPEDPVFWTLCGDAEVRLRPDTPWRARGLFVEALRRAQQSPQLATPELLNHVRDEMERIRRFVPSFLSPFFGGGAGHDDEDDEEFDLPDRTPSPRRRRPDAREQSELTRNLALELSAFVSDEELLATMPPEFRPIVDELARTTGRPPQKIVRELFDKIHSGSLD